jgi:hypothetical protein
MVGGGEKAIIPDDAESVNCNTIGTYPHISQGHCIFIDTAGSKEPARYAIIELDKLITSHLPQNFAINDKYPANCQEREYHSSSQLQSNFLKRVNGFSPRFLISDDPSAINGPPIITPKGVVLGGNSRAMMLQMIETQHPKQK